MMRTGKRVISIFAVICMLCMFLPQAAVMAADEGKTDLGKLSDGCYKLESSTYTLSADIKTEGYISVPSGVTATLDLNGHTIDRGLERCIDKGSVIRVEEGGTLTVKDSSGNNSGKITGGAALNGGGICNHGTLTFEGGTIEGNKAVDEYNGSGGGIYNAKNTGTNATLTIKGGVITGNYAKRGGGIYNLEGSTVNMTGGRIRDNASIEMGGGIYNNGIINMQGNPYIAENTPNGIYLDNTTKISVTGPFNKDAKIDVSAAAENTEITRNYKIWNNISSPYTLFFVTDSVDELSESEVGGEVFYKAKEGIRYIHRIWDDEKKRINSIMLRSAEAIRYTGGDFEEGKFYYVEGDTKISDRAVVNPGASVHLIVCDGADVKFKNGIRVKTLAGLQIHGQTANTGKLYADSDGYNDAAIGSNGYGKKSDNGDIQSGDITIHGAHITAEGRWDAAAIGGGYESVNADIRILSGSVKATGGRNGAGIGTGYYTGYYYGHTENPQRVEIFGGIVEAQGGTDAAGIGGGYVEDVSNKDKGGGNVSIYGGQVIARGGEDGAGIGGGRNQANGQIEIYGGVVQAYGDDDSAGIGSGDKAWSSKPVRIHGGTVTANGGKYGAGIGGGNQGSNGGALEVYGGTVTANGGKYGAGIGGGSQSSNGGTVAVHGGIVNANGGEYGAGIGGGDKSKGARVMIDGGTVNAQGGTYGAGIGGGNNSEMNNGETDIDFEILGGHVIAAGGTYGAGIGGGYQANGRGISSISGGILEARAGTSTTASAIGCGYVDRNKRDVPSPTIHINGCKVIVRNSANNAERTVLKTKRHDACIWRKYVRFESCDHTDATYSIVTEDGVSKHKLACKYCFATETEEHIYEENSDVCDICGYGRPEYTVSFDANGGSGKIDSLTVADGKTIILPPCGFTAPEGMAFDCWEIDLLEYAPDEESLMITENTTVKAVWKSVYTVNASVANNTGGEIYGADTVDSGASVTLTAKAADGYRIKEWKDNGTVVENNKTEVYTINNIEDNHNVTVEFERVAYTVTFDTDGGSQIPPQIVNSGEKLTAPAQPVKSDCKFVNWQLGGEDYNFDTAVTGDITLKATWEQLYRLNVVSLGSGTVTGSGMYPADKKIALKATPDEGAEFNGWYVAGTDELISEDPEYDEYTMPENNATIYASFTEPEEDEIYAIIASVYPADVAETSGSGLYAEGDDVTLTVTDAEDYCFMGWYDNIDGSYLGDENELIMTAEESMDITAVFMKPIVTIDDGTTVKTIEAAYDKPLDAALLAAPTREDYTFNGWYVDNELYDADAPVTEDLVIVAKWLKNPKTVSTDVSLAGGAIDGAGKYGEGAAVTLTATPNEGYEFKNWTDANGNVVSVENPYTFAMGDNNVELHANFIKVVTDITLTSAAQVMINSEYTPTATVTPADAVNNNIVWSLISKPEGTTFEGGTVKTGATAGMVTLRARIAGGKGSGDFIKDFNIEVKEPPRYNVNASASDGGTVTGGGSFTEGAGVTLTARAAKGYAFTNWTNAEGNVVTADNPYKFTMSTADITLRANFVKVVTDITLTSTAETKVNSEYTPLTTVTPSDAVNTDITWSLISKPEGTTFEDGVLKTGAAAGMVTLRATIAGGKGNADYIKDFNIPVKGEDPMVYYYQLGLDGTWNVAAELTDTAKEASYTPKDVDGYIFTGYSVDEYKEETDRADMDEAAIPVTEGTKSLYLYYVPDSYEDGIMFTGDMEKLAISSSTENTYCVIFASYRDNALVKCQAVSEQEVRNGIQLIDIPAGFDTDDVDVVQAFLWKDIGGQFPVCDGAAYYK